FWPAPRPYPSDRKIAAFCGGWFSRPLCGILAAMHIHISISQQTLTFTDTRGQHHCFSVSTAKNGPNQQEGSGGTPLGKHRVRAKIGADAPLNAVFVGRRFTGEIYTPELGAQHPERDWILTRILWLA